MRQRIFFKYEKRIRDLSSLEKIYDYFATHEHSSTKVMSSQDVVHALVPTYPPVGSNVVRAGFLDGEAVVVGLMDRRICLHGNSQGERSRAQLCRFGSRHIKPGLPASLAYQWPLHHLKDSLQDSLRNRLL